MTFARKVQVGGVVYITYGPDAGNLAVITDIIDHSRVLVEGPLVKRQSLSFKRCTLTPLVLQIPRSIGSKALKKQMEAQDLMGKWNKTAWAKKIQTRALRASLGDFDRFQVMLNRKKAATIVNKKVALIRKSANKK